MASAIRSRKRNLRSLCASAARSLAFVSSEYSDGLMCFKSLRIYCFRQGLFLECCILLRFHKLADHLDLVVKHFLGEAGAGNEKSGGENF